MDCTARSKRVSAELEPVLWYKCDIQTPPLRSQQDHKHCHSHIASYQWGTNNRLRHGGASHLGQCGLHILRNLLLGNKHVVQVDLGNHSAHNVEHIPEGRTPLRLMYTL